MIYDFVKMASDAGVGPKQPVDYEIDLHKETSRDPLACTRCEKAILAVIAVMTTLLVIGCIYAVIMTLL